MLSTIEGRVLGDMLPITAAELPRVEWDSFDAGFQQRVQLFDLIEDPFEDSNIAGSHREMVDLMAAMVVEQVRKRMVLLQ